MSVTRAVLLARGLGTRMRREAANLTLSDAQRDAASQGAKTMMPFARPFLDYSLSVLADAGIREAVLVIGPEHSAIRDYFVATAAGRRVQIGFATQPEARGTADAVLAAAALVPNDSFLVLNGDNLYPLSAVSALASQSGSGLVAFDADALISQSKLEPQRIQQYALLDIDTADHLQDIQEKPPDNHPLLLRQHRRVSMNLWRFTPRIYAACQAIGPSVRGELEIQDAVRWSIREQQERYHCVHSSAGVLDLSSPADIQNVGRQLAGIDPRP
ncbi:MAG: sugar phosphate nucleotidyltransferase [Pseudomonadota bacterium]|jgi:glucose-1-phosphate thymidylyltransferase